MCQRPQSPAKWGHGLLSADPRWMKEGTWPSHLARDSISWWTQWTWRWRTWLQSDQQSNCQVLAPKKRNIIYFLIRCKIQLCYLFFLLRSFVPCVTPEEQIVANSFICLKLYEGNSFASGIFRSVDQVQKWVDISGTVQQIAGSIWFAKKYLYNALAGGLKPVREVKMKVRPLVEGPGIGLAG